MIRINTLCALFLLLVTSFSTYAGVTDGDVTAYRLTGQSHFVVFTDDSNDDPFLFDAPLGAALLNGTSCDDGNGALGVHGLVCSGASGDPVADYTCTASAGPPNASDTTWCLFSENPRTGGKAWAVKYVGGIIPTNDGESIVRCKGTDVFHLDYGCWAPPSQISIEGGFIKLDTTDGSAPFGGDCLDTAHYGRMVVDEVNDLLYICTESGWISK